MATDAKLAEAHRAMLETLCRCAEAQDPEATYRPYNPARDGAIAEFAQIMAERHPGTRWELVEGDGKEVV